MKCRDCQYSKEDGVNSYFGGGLYWITYCQREPHRMKLVDADVERQCENFKEVEPCKDIAQTVEV